MIEKKILFVTDISNRTLLDQLRKIYKTLFKIKNDYNNSIRILLIKDCCYQAACLNAKKKKD